MQAELKMIPPTQEMRESFYNYVRYEINAARVKAGLPMLDSSQSMWWLDTAWRFLNKHGTLKSPGA